MTRMTLIGDFAYVSQRILKSKSRVESHCAGNNALYPYKSSPAFSHCYPGVTGDSLALLRSGDKRM